MGKVNQDRYGKSTPKLVPDDIDGDCVVLTIANFGEETFNDEGVTRITPYIDFEETGDKVLWLNKTQVGYLIERLGDESDRWKGAPVPIGRHDSQYNGKTHKKLWVMPPERWDDVLAEAGKGPKRRARPGAVKSSAKGKRRR